MERWCSCSDSPYCCSQGLKEEALYKVKKAVSDLQEVVEGVGRSEGMGRELAEKVVRIKDQACVCQM